MLSEHRLPHVGMSQISCHDLRYIMRIVPLSDIAGSWCSGSTSGHYEEPLRCIPFRQFVRAPVVSSFKRRPEDLCSNHSKSESFASRLACPSTDPRFVVEKKDFITSASREGLSKRFIPMFCDRRIRVSITCVRHHQCHSFPSCHQSRSRHSSAPVQAQTSFQLAALASLRQL